MRKYQTTYKHLYFWNLWIVNILIEKIFTVRETKTWVSNLTRICMYMLDLIPFLMVTARALL